MFLKKIHFFFNEIYKGVFGTGKDLGKTPRPWRIDLILHIVRAAWLDIADTVYLKFGHMCKNIEFLYLTDLLGNLVPLVLDVYAVHHRGGNWPAYEEACMRCWSDLFLQFDRKNYKRAPLMFFSDIFYWMKISHPIIEMFTNHLPLLSDCPVEIFHSIVRRCTPKFFTAEQLQSEARFIFQCREDNEFRQQFVNSVKYPYTPKQLDMLSKKCAKLLLDKFTRIYQTRNQYPLIIESSSDGINTYKLFSLGYEVTDRHLPRGFVTSRKPNTAILCDYMNCNSNSSDGSILACGHGYHSLCLQDSQFKCFICFDYLKGEVKKNVEALITSLLKEKVKVKKESNKNREDAGEDDWNNLGAVKDDIVVIENRLELTKELFLAL